MTRILDVAGLDAPDRLARPARVPRHRPDRARRRDRVRRARRRPPRCRPAGPTSRTAAATASSGANDEARFGYASSARAPGSASCCRRGSASGGTRRGDLEVEEEPVDGAPARLRRRAPLRAGRDRDPGSGPPRRPLRRPRLRRPARGRSSSSPSTATSRAGRASATRWARARPSRVGYDLALTELRGRAALPRRGRQRRGDGAPRRARRRGRDRRGPGPRRRRRAARRAPSRAWAASSTRADIRDLLRANLEHPRWDEVAERCLTCGNCTLACPTCFCTTVEDANDLDGQRRPLPRLGLVLLGRLLVHPRRRDPAVAESPLPPVAHPQARHLARPVRQLRLRRLRPLHHLVPGRHRHHRGGRRHPRDRKRRHA